VNDVFTGEIMLPGVHTPHHDIEVLNTKETRF